MSLGCAGLIDLIVLIKDYAFLGTSAHESVATAGYLPATRLIAVMCRDLKSNEKTRMERGSAVQGRIWAPVGPSWDQLGQTWGQLGAYLSPFRTNLGELGTILNQLGTILGPTWPQKT